MKGIRKKLAIIAVIVFAVAFIAIALYAFVPDAKAGMDYYLGPTGQNITNGISAGWIGFTTSEAYLMYITPNIPWIFLSLGIVVTIFVLHPLWHTVTGWFAARHEYKMSTTLQPSTGTMREPQSVIVQESPTPTRTITQTAETKPTPVATEEPKKEASA